MSPAKRIESNRFSWTKCPLWLPKNRAATANRVAPYDHTSLRYRRTTANKASCTPHSSSGEKTKMSEQVAVIGGGSWGCALAHVIGSNGFPVTLYVRRAEQADEIRIHHTNQRYLKDYPLSQVEVPGFVDDVEAAVDGEEEAVEEPVGEEAEP